MTALPADRRRIRRVASRALLALAALAVTATLAGALQVREVRVTGTHRFPAGDVETVLRSALGTPTIAARAGELRGSVCAIRWVADATVRISLDGVVTCSVRERTPVAVARDGSARQLVDREGRMLAPAPPDAPPLELDGFGAYPEERAAVLAATGALERGWNGTLRRAERLGPENVALEFAGTPFPVLADPADPQSLVAARQVVSAWRAAGNPEPLRVDARVPGRIALAPAPPAAEGGE